MKIHRSLPVIHEDVGSTSSNLIYRVMPVSITRRANYLLLK
jgi:hypothetical protein